MVAWHLLCELFTIQLINLYAHSLASGAKDEKVLLMRFEQALQKVKIKPKTVSDVLLADVFVDDYFGDSDCS